MARPLLSMILGLAVAMVHCARADDGAMLAAGGSIRLMDEHPTIAMTREFVHAHVRPDSVIVDCWFYLTNHGAATRVTIGFPCGSGGSDVERAEPFDRFDSWVDGKRVTTRMAADSASSRFAEEEFRAWYLKDVAFAHGQTRCVHDRYVTHLGNSVPDFREFAYTLWTGGSWSGPIGTADIVVSVDGMPPLYDTNPPATQINARGLRWHFRNLEPRINSSTAGVGAMWSPTQSRGRDREQAEESGQHEPDR